MRSHNFNNKNIQFKESALLNSLTFQDYLLRLKKIATSIFEWQNLPSSMNARFLEETLFYFRLRNFFKR